MNDGKEVETIELKEYDDSEEALYALFSEKGFERVSGEELREALEKRAEEERVERERKLENKKRRESLDKDPAAMKGLDEAFEERAKAFAKMVRGNKKRSHSDPAAIEQSNKAFAEIENEGSKKRSEGVNSDP